MKLMGLVCLGAYLMCSAMDSERTGRCKYGPREAISIAHAQADRSVGDALWQIFRNEHGLDDDWQAREAVITRAEISRNRMRAHCRNLALECISVELPYGSQLAREVRAASKKKNPSDEKMNSKQVSLLLENSKKQISKKAQKQVAAILAMAR